MKFSSGWLFGDSAGPMCTALRNNVCLVPVVFCCVAFLRAGETNANLNQSSGCEGQPQWSLLSALATLSGAMNLSHIFVLHFTSGYLVDEPVRLTEYVFFATLTMTFVISAAAALFVYLTIDAPLHAVLRGSCARTLPDRDSETKQCYTQACVLVFDPSIMDYHFLQNATLMK